MSVHKLGVSSGHYNGDGNCKQNISMVEICLGPNFFGSFFFIILIFYCYSITVACLFSPSLHPTPVEPPSLPTSTLPPDFVHVSFIVVPVISSPHCPLPTPPSLVLIGASSNLLLIQ